MTRYAKMIVALIGAVGTWAATYFPDNHNVQIAVGLASALVTVATVYLVPNTPPAGQPSDPGISEQDPPVAKARKRKRRSDAGEASGLLVLAVVLLLIAIIGGFTATHVLFWLLVVAFIVALIGLL